MMLQTSSTDRNLNRDQHIGRQEGQTVEQASSLKDLLSKLRARETALSTLGTTEKKDEFQHQVPDRRD